MKPIVDMHLHTTLSLCCHDENATLQAYIDKGAEMGMQVLGVTNHCWDHPTMPGASANYQIQNVEHALKIRDEIPEDTKGIKLYIGIETEYYGMYDHFGMSAEAAKNFDYVMVPFSHTHGRGKVMPFDKPYLDAIDSIRERLRIAFPEVSDRQIDKWMNANRVADIKAVLGYEPEPDLELAVKWQQKNFFGLMDNEEFNKMCQVVPTFIAHPFSAGGFSAENVRKIVSMIDDEVFKKMFTLMAQKGVGYDARVSNFDTENPDTCQFHRIARIARDCGVLFTFSTDAHSLIAFERAVKSADIYRTLELTPDNLHPLIREYVK